MSVSPHFTHSSSSVTMENGTQTGNPGTHSANDSRDSNNEDAKVLLPTDAIQTIDIDKPWEMSDIQPYDPLEGGIAFGALDEDTKVQVMGTLGILVYDGSSGQKGFITYGAGLKAGMKAFQPPLGVEGCRRIGVISCVKTTQECHCAFVCLDEAIAAVETIAEIGVVDRTVHSLTPGQECAAPMMVVKRGFKTRFTTQARCVGRPQSTLSYQDVHGNEHTLKEPLVVVSPNVFGAAGDSGAVLVEATSKQLLGILNGQGAAEQDTRQGTRVLPIWVFTPMSQALHALGCRL